MSHRHHRPHRAFVLTSLALAVGLAFPAGAAEPPAARAIDHRAVLGEPAGEPLAGEALGRETERVSGLLRCVSCQGLSVAASPAPAALAMKNEVRDLLADGYVEEQILDYFEGGYGEFIRLAPKAEGFNLVVWVAPVAALILGALLIGLRLRGRQRTADGPADDDAEGLGDYVDRVRREVDE